MTNKCSPSNLWRDRRAPLLRSPALWSQFAGVSKRAWILPGFIFSAITNRLHILLSFKKCHISFKWNCWMVAAKTSSKGDLDITESCWSITPFLFGLQDQYNIPFAFPQGRDMLVPLSYFNWRSIKRKSTTHSSCFVAQFWQHGTAPGLKWRYFFRQAEERKSASRQAVGRALAAGDGFSRSGGCIASR